MFIVPAFIDSRVPTNACPQLFLLWPFYGINFFAVKNSPHHHSLYIGRDLPLSCSHLFRLETGREPTGGGGQHSYRYGSASARGSTSCSKKGSRNPMFLSTCCKHFFTLST
jgi:hypothetical protein